MVYSVAITKSGQMTLPKELRIFLGVDGMSRITLKKSKDGVVISKRMSEEEFFAAIDEHIPTKAREIAKKDGNKSVSEIIKETRNSAEAKKKLEEEYGQH